MLWLIVVGVFAGFGGLGFTVLMGLVGFIELMGLQGFGFCFGALKTWIRKGSFRKYLQVTVESYRSISDNSYYVWMVAKLAEFACLSFWKVQGSGFPEDLARFRRYCLHTRRRWS